MGEKGSGKGKKVAEDRTDWFTIRENEFLVLLKRFKVVKAVASELGVSYRRAEAILMNIRRKWVWSVNTNNRILAMSKGDMAFRKLLCQPVRRVPQIVREPPTPIEEEEFFEGEEIE